MQENGFYIIKKDFFDIIVKLGGEWDDGDCFKRPTYCCIPDMKIKGLYWAIPTSDLSHRTPEQKAKYERYMSLPKGNEGWAYYHIGRTNKPALFKISSCFPITEKYIDHEFTTNGNHLVMAHPETIKEINKKFRRILAIEIRNPNKFPQHITDIKTYLVSELND